jgi:hypothetical protein
VHGEPVDPATAIGSSEGPMQKKGLHSKVQVRFFEPPEVPLESIDERGEGKGHKALHLNIVCNLGFNIFHVGRGKSLILWSMIWH